MTTGGGPQLSAREAFLRALAANLRLDPDTQADVLDELADHLDDSIAGLEEAGAAPEDAERQAVRRLGDPIDLARGIRRAHQRRRRLLAAAGGGILGAADGIARQIVPIVALFTLGPIFYFLVLAAWTALTHTAVPLRLSGSGVEIGITTLLALGGSRRMVWAVARGARRPLGGAAIITGAIGVAAIASWSLVGPAVTLTDTTVWADAGAAVAWLLGCASVGRVGDLALTKRRAIIASVAVAAILFGRFLVWPPAGGHSFDGRDPDLRSIGLTLDEDNWVYNLAEHGNLRDAGTYPADFDTTDEFADSGPRLIDRATDARLELWPAILLDTGYPSSIDSVGELDPAYASPIRTTPMQVRGGHITGSIRFDDIRGLEAAYVVATASIDGKRYVLGSAGVVPEFHGNLLAWLSQPAHPPVGR